MQHIEARPSREARQHCLVPEDVLDWRPMALVHRLEAHPAGGECEQRQILPEDEKRELMLGSRGQERARKR